MGTVGMVYLFRQPAGRTRAAGWQVQLPPGQYTITLLAGSEAHQGLAEVTITVGTEEGSF